MQPTKSNMNKKVRLTQEVKDWKEVKDLFTNFTAT